MAFAILKDAQQSAVFFLIILLTPLAIAATYFRFVASRMSLGKLGIEDWLALSALIFYLGFIAGFAAMIHVMQGRAMSTLQMDEVQLLLKLTYAMNVMFPFQQAVSKFSILCLYHRVFGVKSAFSKWIKLVALIEILYFIATFLGLALICVPVKRFWHPWWTTGHCINLSHFLAGVETVNSLVDFSMVVLALYMLQEVQIGFANKLKVASVFIVAGMTGIIGFIKIGFSYHATTDTQMTLGLWDIVQMAFSVWCCCVITYKPLFARIGSLHTLTSKFRSYGSKYSKDQTSSTTSGNGSHGAYINLDGSNMAPSTTVQSRVYGPTAHDRGVEATSRPAGDGSNNHNTDGYPMKVLHIQQKIEYVQV